MNKEPDLSDQRPDEIRHLIEETRSSLTERLEMLEHQVKQTVGGATDAVKDTVQTVRNTVEGTVETVKQKVEQTVESVTQVLDVRHQVQQHPWAMFGGSIALGYLAGTILPRDLQRVRWSSPGYSPREDEYSAQRAETITREDRFQSAGNGFREEISEGTGSASGRPGFWSELARQFAPEIDQVKKLAIGTTVGLIRDMINEAVPENLSPQVASIVDSVTSKLGGEPVQGSVVSRSGRREPAQHNGVS
jgi:ElaB/YqjD/DUF883 family membrane-anchored ribosome-binding protein